MDKKRSDPGFSVRGFRAGAVASGIKKGGKKDLALIVSDVPAAVAGVFTRNAVRAAPVLLSIARVKKGGARGVIINSGNANACTGKRGLRLAGDMAEAAEKNLRVKKGDMLVASTGVIGVPLPVEKIISSVPGLVQSLRPDGWMDAAEAIMTTDAFPKTASGRKRINGRYVNIIGIAKGAGMICPDMATMLAVFATDAPIDPASLKKALLSTADESFNRITVDNDTSTNDCVFIFANGLAGGGALAAGGAGFDQFRELLCGLSLELSHMIVRDGEGATKFTEIEVTGCRSRSDAEAAARRIAGSLLVKTALFGGDPNWGRIMAAVGACGIRLKEDRVDISINGVKVVKNGLDTGMEKAAAAAMKKKEIKLMVDIKLGRGGARLWTSDLSYDYVRINSSYRS